MSLAEPTHVTGGGQTAVQNPATAVNLGADGTAGNATPRASSHQETETDSARKDVKNKVRGLFGLGKKKEDSNVSKKPSSSAASSAKPQSSTVTSKPSMSRDPSRTSARSAASPAHPSSPGGGMSSSPRLSSPAGSQIFERDVDNMSMKPQSPAIPSHIQTENHIPPVLDASSEAITDNHLDPDSVEIVTHAQHQPAAAAVTGANGTPYAPDHTAASWTEELRAFADRDDASNSNPQDNTDIRRLSFISFADVVQAEQSGLSGVAGSRDSIHVAGLTSLSSVNARSPSPIRSPVSSQGPGTSPPTSTPGSIKGLEMSPARNPLGSPISSHHNFNMGGDINIETMSQALKRTGSADLSVARSYPASPIEGLLR